MKVIDLVKRLRCDHPDQLTCEAADRIEELEAKLAKAVERIEDWQSTGCPYCHGDCSSANPPVSNCIMQSTRTTLAELKGQNDD